MKILASIATLAMLAGLAPCAAAITPDEVMARYDQGVRASSEQVKLTMRLVNPQGKVRERFIDYQTKANREGKQNSLLRFVEPADVRGTALLTIEHAKQADDRWLYLPAMRKVRRIAATEDSDNFMGSDFAYEDIDFENLEGHTYTLVKTEVIKGAECYVIQAVPKEELKDKTGYSKRLLWIRKDNFAVAYAEYYDKKEELLKRRQAFDLFDVDASGKWRPRRQEMTNVKTGHQTELLYDGYRIGKEIPDDVFSQRTLAEDN